ncbi:MAG: ABC transporter permease [Caldilineae bacterium]|nr:MAG: ABC transporter permease [Caldilineae bacterium]
MTASTSLQAGTASKDVPFLLRFRNIGVFAVLFILVIGAAIFTPKHTFIGEANITTLLALGSEFGVIALGVGMLMVAGEFDLSVGSVLVFCAFIYVVVLEAVGNPFLSAVVTLICGALLGALNGIIVVRGRIVSFVATLGAMLSWRGLSEILSGGVVRTVPLKPESAFVQLLTGKIGGVLPAQFIWFVFLAIIFYFVLNRGRFGNWIYSTGDNVHAARAMGIRTGTVKIICFTIVGALSAFAALLQTTRLTAFSVHMGEGWELRAVAAAVVGGVSLQGGRGSMVGIFLGALIIIVVDNMISQLRLAYEWTFIVFGIVIMASVLLDLWIERRIQRVS